MKLILLTGVLSLSFFKPLAADAREGREGVGVPGPQVAKCLAVGGDIEYVSAQSGAVGLCKIGDGLIGDWTLFSQSSSTPQLAVERFLNHTPAKQWGGGNPASQYCGDVGGNSVLVEDARGNQSGVCEFSDKSQIEEWTLFRGPQDPGNARLVDALTNQN